MPKQVKAEYNTFVKGLITEASPLNFPENASLLEENFVLYRDGRRKRRLGIDLEDNYAIQTLGVSYGELTELNPVQYQWQSPGGFDDVTILVIQTNNFLHFFNQTFEDLSSDGFINYLETTLPTNVQYSFASVDGRLVVASGSKEIAVVTYDGTTTLTITYSRIKTRDVWGVEVVGSLYETDKTYRGATTPPDAHKYNLQNQSWGIPRKDSEGVASDPTVLYYGNLTKYPSNAQAVWPGLQFQPIVGATPPFERLYSILFEDAIGADTMAAKGYYIIDALDRGTSRETEFLANKTKYPELAYASVSLPDDSTPSGATVITDFAGRVFYGGFSGKVTSGDARSPNLASYIFFSQLVKNKSDFFKCYQEGDPTSRENSDLLETDGGFIRISGMNKLLGMVDLGANLIVIADNGVWSVTGGSDFGFSPLNLKVSNISSFGGVGNQSIVKVQSKCVFWGSDGIYLIDKNQFGDLNVNSLTDNTIQTLFDEIPVDSKTRVSGAYNPFSKKIHWIYKQGEIFLESTKTNELIFDTVLGAFSVNRIYPRTFTVDVPNYEIFVTIPPLLSSPTVDYLKYLTAIGVEEDVPGFSFSNYKNENFEDWSVGNGQIGQGSGVDAEAFLVCGEVTGGDSDVRKFLPYVTVHMDRTEDGVDDATLVPEHSSGCLMQVRWGWSDTATSNKWSRQQQIYRYPKPRLAEGPDDDYDTGFKMITTKNKVRGSGRSFSICFNSEPGKDCRLVGWNIRGLANDV